MPSHRGGASAPAHCKSTLGACMTRVVRGGGTLRAAGKSCMSAFNSCRTGRKTRKAKSTRKHRSHKRR